MNPTEDPVRGSILHLIIERGSVPTLKYVLDHGGDKMIKISDQDLNTPLMFALKLHKGSPIPLEITQKDLSKAEFNKELPQALKELDLKESVRFDTAKIKDMIRLLIKAGAPVYLSDKQHWLPAERINRFMLLPEADRKILLQALDLPFTPKKIRSLNMEDMAKTLDTLALEHPVIAGKLRMARWALESAVKEDDKDI